ncbi:hypothetical protein CR513_59516, partial [Mucuna pruriens]
MMLNLVKVQKVEIEIISTMEEKKITREEDVTISTKVEITTSYHIIKQEMETILVLSSEEEDMVTIIRNKQILIILFNTFLEDESIVYLDTWYSNHVCEKKELFSAIDETVIYCKI